MTQTADSRRTSEPEPETDAEPGVEESSNGVDDSLILWFLSLSPLERLQWAQEMADAVTELRAEP